MNKSGLLNATKWIILYGKSTGTNKVNKLEVNEAQIRGEIGIRKVEEHKHFILNFKTVGDSGLYWIGCGKQSQQHSHDN
jgi:hypothetical protein